MGRPKGSAPIEPCKLCGTVGPLAWSHILPRWTYRRLARTAEPGRQIPVVVRNKVAMLQSDQLADFLLGRECEDKFGRWETYVSSISRNRHLFPALDTAKAHLLPGGAGKKMLTMQGADISELDVDAISRFAVSVLWRAAICPEFFPDIDLGPYADAFAGYLRGESPFPSRVRLLLHLIDCDPVPQLSQMVTPPCGARVQGRHCYNFLLFGMSFEFFVGNNVSVFDNACLPRSERAIVTNGYRQFRGIADQAHGTKPRGVLATRA